MNKKLVAISFIFALLLLYCWNKSLPYLYFQFIRIVGMVVFSLLAYYNLKQQKLAFAIIFAISVLIINPFIKISLGRFYWNITDTIWAILIIFNGIQSINNNKEQANTIE